MKTESKADLQIAMIREDVSQPVIDYVMALNPSRLAYRIAKWAYIFASLPGTLFCAIYLADSNDRIANALALARANEMGGLLFRGFFGIAFVTSLFAWLFATTAIFNFIMTRTPRLRASLFVFSLADERASPLMTWSGKRPKNAIALDPSTYLIAATGGRNRNVALAAL